MKNDRNMSIKIRRMSIRNYKSIDELEMEFPSPRMSDDPDIIVMGSRNGLGKTSVIECCSLMLHALSFGKDHFLLQDRYSIVDVPDLIIKSGADSSEIDADIDVGDKQETVHVSINRKGDVKISGKNKIHNKRSDHETDDFIKAICGLTPNPVVEDTFLLFHSYRKVQEGNPELGMMVDRGRSLRRTLFPRYEFPMSAFKLRILRSLMGKANLFEFAEDQKSDETIEKLNELMRNYAGGTIRKLRPSQDNTVDFRVEPIHGSGSFTFDGLSSGQKEIISTLFLIWYHTQVNPSVVFIDEPELHLNAEWHRSFVKNLVNLAPKNQYILATHSEDVMDSVDEDRRLLLQSNQEGDE